VPSSRCSACSFQYLHSQAFVHRDIKPRNIFLAYDAKDPSCVHVKLGDFGLATLIESQSTCDSAEQWKSNESTGVGTALYAPPEQLNSSGGCITDKSDSYSLGIVLFEIFNIFSTEMERLCCLSDLRSRSQVESSFAHAYPFESSLIEQAVSIDSSQRPTVTYMLNKYADELQRRRKATTLISKQMIIDQLRETLRDKDRQIQQLQLQLQGKDSHSC
jgi:serine/threonine protein kinase